MKYEIIATLGPASDDLAVWNEMIRSGVTAFRLNTSHMTLDQVNQWLERLLIAMDRVVIVLDLQGSKWRLGQFDSFELIAGDVIELRFGHQIENKGVLPVPHADFFTAVDDSNGEILVNDARQKLSIVSQDQYCVKARVEMGGTISSHKGITLAQTNFRSEGLSQKDLAIVNGTQHIDAVRYAISYVKDSMEMRRYREEINSSKYLIAKLERSQAVDETVQIAKNCDEMWVCRGDLGAELGLPGMAQAVGQISRQVRNLPVPVVLAGQVFEHVSGHPIPTRAEVCNLYDALMAGYRGVVLSDETAIGRYPLRAVEAAGLFLEN